MTLRKVSPRRAPGRKPKAYSYARFSTPEQLKGDSLRRQADMAARYAEAHGLELDASLTMRDLGVSAYRGSNLSDTSALGAFLTAIEAGDVSPGSVLLVEALDRISRQVARKAVRVLEDIVEAGVDVVTLADGKRYTKESLDGFDFVMAIILLIRGNEESAMKSRRLKAAWVGKRQRIGDGKALTRHVPGWITTDAQKRLTLIPERAEVVRKVVRWAIEGAGRNSIVKRLNAESVPTFGRAPHWHPSYIFKLLASPALVGTFIPHVEDHKDGKLIRTPLAPVPDYYPAVIDRDTYERLQSIAAKSTLRGRHASGEVRNLLSGLSKCSYCGFTMTRVDKGNRSKPSLVCTQAKNGAGCQYISVKADDVEAAFIESAGYLANSAPAPDAAAEEALQKARLAHDGLDSQLQQMLDLLERAPSEALAHRVAALEVDLKAARENVNSAEEAARQSETRLNLLKTGELQAALEAHPLDRRRANAALRALAHSVEIDPGHGTAVVRWRLGGETSVTFGFPPDEGSNPLVRGARRRRKVT